MAQKSRRKATSKRKPAKKTPRTQARAKTTAPMLQGRSRSRRRESLAQQAAAEAGRLRARRTATEPPRRPSAPNAKTSSEERREELARRIREYKATMAIMKKRGARTAAGERRCARPNGTNLQRRVASFDAAADLRRGGFLVRLSGPFFGGGIIPRLENRLGVPILNLAKAGDEVRYMLGVEQRKLLTEQLSNGCPAGGAWDVLLFSGGGNDIVDNPMALWIKDWDPAVPPAEPHPPGAFRHCTGLGARWIRRPDLRCATTLSPSTHLVFHGYDFAIPDGRGNLPFRPVAQADLRPAQISDAGGEIRRSSRRCCEQFAAMLTSLATQPKVTFINGQGTLPQQPASWHNELHPTRRTVLKSLRTFSTGN